RPEYSGTGAFSLEVFDRWGRPLFSADDPIGGWDGFTPEGNPAEAGVYFYALSVAGQAYRGQVTLVR
ncbi:MAG: gliding motility-associated C-terminal domain-containing protein, partial [Bacteroidia bacterium]|nr:gliding motility-associated C-terminal domain-containing protein [Bacteroidia bacterium]